MSTPVKFTVELDSKAEAEALSQFLKRVSYSTCESLSDPTRKDEPYLMLDGLAGVARGLAIVGYNPR